MAKLHQLPGGEGPVNDGERAVVEALRTGLGDDWIIVPNVELFDRLRIYECDVLLFGRGRIFVIETKDIAGEVRAGCRDWLISGQSRKSPLRTTELKAKVLKSQLVNRSLKYTNVPVESLVVLAREPLRLTVDKQIVSRVMLIKDLNSRILKWPGSNNEVAPEQLVRECGLALRVPAGHRRLGEYVVTEHLEEGDAEAWYIGRHEAMPSAPQVRLWHVRPDLYSWKSEEVERWRRRAIRECEAIRLMGPHPGVDGARDFVSLDDGSLLVAFDLHEGVSLRHVLDMGLTRERALHVLEQITTTLRHAHSHGVVHRRLSPEHIFLEENDRTVIRGFGLSKLTSADAETVVGKPSPDLGPIAYLAPEVAMC